MKNISTRSAFLFCLGLVLWTGCKTGQIPVKPDPKKPINFCGEFSHGDQSPRYCECTADSVQNPDGQFVKKPNYKWFDRFGNRYCNLYIKDPCSNKGVDKRSIVPGVNFSSPNKQSAGGLFNLYFSDIQNGLTTGFGDPNNAAYLDVIAQVFSDIDAMLVTPATSCGNPFVPVNIEIQSMNSQGSGILGEASAYHEYLGENSGIKHNEVWKAINSGANDPALWDGYIRINLGYTNWYTGYAGPVTAGKVDLYTVVLHEVLHAMGFASLIAENGGSKFHPNGPALNNYSIFDKFLKFDNAQTNINNANVITNSGGYNLAYNVNSNPATDLRSGCQNPTPTGPDIKFSGSNNPSSYVYTPALWSNGSSISHFQIGCDGAATSQFVMNPSIGYAIARRITTEEANTLCDIGYKLSGTYGTAVLDANGNSNPNLKSIPSCGQLLVAVDDKGPCCTNNNFTVQWCPNTTLTIHTSDLICNDVFTGNVTVTDFEIISTGAAVPPSGNDFIYTPAQLGQDILRYRLQDNMGNKSNYAYVFVFVTACPNFSCNNTSICNMICNPNFEDYDNNCTNSCFGTNNGYNGILVLGNCCIEGWQQLFQSPDFSQNCSNITYLTGNPGGMVQISGSSDFNITFPGHNEAIMTSVQVQQNKKYIISFHAKRLNSTLPADHLRYGLINQLSLNNWHYGGYWGWWNPNQYSKPFPTTNFPQQIIDILNPSQFSNDWTQFVNCFSSGDNFDRFFLQVGRNDGLNSLGRNLVDFIELVEDKIDNMQTNYSTLCGQSLIIGENLCSISNMNYSWWDVTNSSNPIQLTNGLTIMAGGVSIPSTNTNGSQIQVSPNQSRIYELRRRMISQNGIPVTVANSCDKDVQVTVTVNANITIQKTVLSSTPASPGSTVQFQLVIHNSTGTSLTNVMVNDLLNTYFNTNTLSFGYNPNVTHMVNANNVDFTILSLPDGATENINYSVQLGSSTNQTTVSNCAKVEYAGCFVEDCVDIAVVPCNGKYNLMVRDDPSDEGLELNPGYIWSGDIWNCNNNANCTFMENPEYKTNGYNHLNVRIRNIGCADYVPSSSNNAFIHLYWTIGRTGEYWDAYWVQSIQNQINNHSAGSELTQTSGYLIPAIPAGGEWIYSLPWTPPNPADFLLGQSPMLCFLARIVSAVDPITGEMIGPSAEIGPNVRASNNIATINTALVNIDTLNVFVINNPYDREVKFNLSLSASDKSIENFLAHGSVELSVASKNKGNFASASVSSNVKKLSGTKFIIHGESKTGEINNIVLKPKETIVVNLKFSLSGEPKATKDKQYQIRVAGKYQDAKISSTEFNYIIKTKRK